MNSANEVKNAVSAGKTIFLVPHINPDGDSVASVFALKKIIDLNFEGKTVIPVLRYKGKNPLPFLNGIEAGKDFDEVAQIKPDTVIAVDVAAKDRLSDMLSVFENTENTINIDHHKTNPLFGKYNYVKPELCSAGAVLYDFCKEAGLKINDDIAADLYVSILSDTGGFRHDNTTAETFSTAAELAKFDINPTLLYRKTLEQGSKESVLFSAYAISRAEFAFKDKVAYSVITIDDMKKFNALNEHTDSVAETLRKIKSVDVAFTVKELENGFSKVSLRSKTVDVSKIAEIFDGGGHERAAGCVIKKPYITACNKLLEYLENAVTE